MDKIIYALESFKNMQDLIKFADQKAGAIVVIVGLIFTCFVQYIEKLTFSIDKITIYGVLTFIFGLITIICIVAVLYISIFKILKPRFAKNYKVDEKSSFYFAHISLDKIDIHNIYMSIDKKVMLKDIIDQQFEVACILTKKNKYLSKSFIWLFTSFIASLFFLLFSKLL